MNQVRVTVDVEAQNFVKSFDLLETDRRCRSMTR